MGGVEGGFALHDGLAGSGRAAASAASDLGDFVPALASRHVDGVLEGRGETVGYVFVEPSGRAEWCAVAVVGGVVAAYIGSGGVC